MFEFDVCAWCVQTLFRTCSLWYVESLFGTSVCELKTLGWKCCVGCEIPPLCGLKLLRTLRIKLYSKPLDVNWVQISCKFLAGIEMYVLRNTIKNKHCSFKKIRNLATDWWQNGSIYFLGTKGGDRMDKPSPLAMENPSLFPPMVATNFSFRRSLPRQFFPR